MLVPELFTTRTHLAVLTGFLAARGWEVYVPDFRAAAAKGGTPALGRLDFATASGLVQEAIAALGRDTIVIGHGLGGLIALALAERPHVRAAIALAPALPGFPSPLLLRLATLFALLRRRPLKPPRGRVLADFVANAGRIEIAEFHAPDDFAKLREKVLINATGYGSRALFGDESIIPVRGQLARVIPQPEINYGLFYKDVSFVPRRDGLVFQVVGASDYYGFNDDSTVPDRAEAELAVNTIAGLYKT